MDSKVLRREVWRRIAAALLFATVTAPLLASDYRVAPIPEWVEPQQIDLGVDQDKSNHRNGVAYLLTDNQWRVSDGGQTLFRRIANKALNTSGVEEVAQITINFDPLYEALVLHELKIHRGALAVDMLERSQISLLQREKDLEYLIYDGTQTLNIILEDVRPGDVVEYSYSIEGVNPVYAGHFAQELLLRWSVPVGAVNYRVLWPRKRALHISTINTDVFPATRVLGDYTEYLWHEERVSELVSDDDTPSWYEPYPIVYLSDQGSWREVIEWALPLYRPQTDTAAVRQVIKEIEADALTTEQRIVAALHFVQDEVRYLGVEMGLRSHKPNSPDRVISQRYGDCKDKSLLLVSLLQGMGVKASPALVNSYGGILLKQALPTPTAFNHAIVHVEFAGRNYWLDPTRNHQGNTLAAIYQPDYDYALVLAKDNSDLVFMSQDTSAVNTKTVEETFDIRGDVNKPAPYEMITEHNQYYADAIRERLSESNLKQLQQSFLNYTARYFPSVVSSGDIEVGDDRKKNRVTVRERYAIPGAWSKSEDERYLLVDFEPFLIDDELKDVAAPKRTMPYSVAHPIRLRHTTRVLMPQDSRIEDESYQIDDKAFRFSKKVRFKDDVLVIEYLYESLKDYVSAEDIQDYSNNIRAARNLSIYSIQMPNPGVAAASAADDEVDKLNWLTVFVVGLVFVGVTFIVVKHIYLYDPPYQGRAEVDARLQGIAGWLLLSAIGVVASPVKIAFDSKDLLMIFSENQWTYLAGEFGSGFLGIILGEFIVNMTMLIMALALILMFFTKRHTFPRFYIAFLLFGAIMQGTDLLVLHLASYPGVVVEDADLMQFYRVVASATVWTLYYLKSERVRGTFIRQRRQDG